MAEKASVSEVRKWAKEQGFQLGDRGRLPAEVWTAWSDARSLPRPRAESSDEVVALTARVAQLEQQVVQLAERLARAEKRADEPRRLFARSK